MKRLLSAVLLLMLFITPASANSWGLTGELLSAVSDVNTWNDYYSTDQQGNVAAMTSRYHNALMWVMDGDSPLQVNTRALWQPDDEREPALLGLWGDGFTLSYGEDEIYYFIPLDDGYVMSQAEIGDFTLETLWLDGVCYCAARENGQEALFYAGESLTLHQFSIRLLPRSLEEVRRLNHTKAALDSGTGLLGWQGDATAPGTLLTASGKGTTPVYAAPTEEGWRAAKGKAAVSLGGDIWVMSQWEDAAGDDWLYIRYEVSQRTERFGFIRAEEVSGQPFTQAQSVSEPSISVPVRAAVDTFVTDDPYVSQYAQQTIPAGTVMQSIGRVGSEYAVVQTVIDGKEAWLFAPLKDLEPIMGEAQPEVMAQMAGLWYYYAGGSMSSEYLQLNADGTFLDPANPDDHGAWLVTAYDPARNRYWNDPPYELTLLYSDGRCNIKGLTYHEENPESEADTGFSLTNGEGGGGYIRVEEAEIEFGEGNG